MSCEMVLAQKIEGQTNTVGQITISRPSKKDPLKIFFQTPANVWLQTGTKFVSDEKEPALVAAFRWCLPSRCLAHAEFNDATVSKLYRQTEPGRVEYKDAAQHDVSIPVSFKGFAPALDFMKRQ
jgi:invasion protein IalB